MLANPTYLVPTLVAYAAILDGRDSLPAPAVANAEEAIERHRESFRAALKGGVPIAIGIDTGTPTTRMGELAGGRPHDGSGHASRSRDQSRDPHRRLANRYWRCRGHRSGYDGRSFLVEGNPLADITCLGNVRNVWARGRRLTPADLASA